MKNIHSPSFEHKLVLLYSKSTQKYPIITAHNLNSYDKFIIEDINKILRNISTFKVLPSYQINNIQEQNKKIQLNISLSDIFIKKPKYNSTYITPIQTLQDISTYSCKLFCNYKLELISYEIINGETFEKSIYKINTSDNDQILPMEIGNLPCMVLSQFCNLRGLTSEELESIGENKDEIGGYFIISGKEYIITSQENKTENMIYRNINDNSYSVWIQSKPTDEYVYGYYTTVTLHKDDSIYVSVYIKKECTFAIPIIIFFKALGIVDEKNIWELILGIDGNSTDEKALLYSNILRKSFVHKFKYKKKDKWNTISSTRVEDNIQEIAENHILEYYKQSKYHNINEHTRKKFFSAFLNKEFLPHIGGIELLKRKIYFLAYMVKRVINLRLGKEKIPDRDDYGNKRMILPGTSYGQLFRHILNVQLKAAKINLSKKIAYFNRLDIKQERIDLWLQTSFNQRGFTQMFEKHIRNSEWPIGSSTSHSIKSGVSKAYNRKSIIDSFMMLQQIAISVKSDSNTPDQVANTRRAVHETQYNCIDGHDTPEGKKVGIIKNKTYMSIISLYIDPITIKKQLDRLNLDLPENIHILSKYGKILINGNWMYVCSIDNINSIYNKILTLRRSGKIHRHTSIIIEREIMEIRIYTDSGRFLWPVYIVDEGNKLRINDVIIEKILNNKYTWKDLIINEIIEYISINEAKFNLLIAINQVELSKSILNKYTHCEISPLCLVSLNSMIIEMANKNAAPRISFQCSMQKQAAGTNVPNYKNRADTKAYLLCRPQRPLSSTLGRTLSLSNKYPNIYNVLVAIMPYGGFNIEDSLQINNGSVRRGFMDMRSIITKQLKINSSSSEEFKKPNKEITRNYQNMSSYDNIDNNGRPKIGAIFNKGDIIIGKVRKISITQKRENNSSNEYEDKSLVYDKLSSGMVTNVSILETSENRIMKVRILIFRKVLIGDKFAAISAQKGTVSQLIPVEYMPFDENGIRPQILFNPGAVGKRMTISHIGTAGTGLIANTIMKHFDCTVFNNMDIYDDIILKLHKLGYKDAGDRVLYNGYTGRKIKNKIFLGYINYQKLQHLVKEKVYGRFTGPINQKTRQPLGGRTHKGGLKFGEMQRDALISHGATALIKEITYDHSDGYSKYISEETNHDCIGNNERNIYIDNKNNTNISNVKITWMSHLAEKLIGASGIFFKYNLESISNNNKKKLDNDYTIPYITNFEKTSLIGNRALQLERGSEPLIKLPDNVDDLDVKQIARDEFKSGALDNYIINRKVPNNCIISKRVGDLIKL